MSARFSFSTGPSNTGSTPVRAVWIAVSTAPTDSMSNRPRIALSRSRSNAPWRLQSGSACRPSTIHQSRGAEPGDRLCVCRTSILRTRAAAPEFGEQWVTCRDCRPALRRCWWWCESTAKCPGRAFECERYAGTTCATVLARRRTIKFGRPRAAGAGRCLLTAMRFSLTLADGLRSSPPAVRRSSSARLGTNVSHRRLFS